MRKHTFQELDRETETALVAAGEWDPSVPYGAALEYEYAEGYTRGVEWAQADRANAIPTAHDVAVFQAEAQTDHRGMRAFYLGALRGYRSVARTLKGGRWGL